MPPEEVLITIGVYVADAEPSRWEYWAELLTPPHRLQERDGRGRLLDLAVLRCVGRLSLQPPAFAGPRAFCGISSFTAHSHVIRTSLIRHSHLIRTSFTPPFMPPFMLSCHFHLVKIDSVSSDSHRFCCLVIMMAIASRSVRWNAFSRESFIHTVMRCSSPVL